MLVEGFSEFIRRIIRDSHLPELYNPDFAQPEFSGNIPRLLPSTEGHGTYLTQDSSLDVIASLPIYQTNVLELIC